MAAALADGLALGSAEGSAAGGGVSAGFALDTTRGSSPEDGFAGGGVSPHAPSAKPRIAGIESARNDEAFMSYRVRLCGREIKANEGSGRGPRRGA